MSNPGSRRGSASRLQPPRSTSSREGVCGRAACSGSGSIPRAGTAVSKLPQRGQTRAAEAVEQGQQRGIFDQERYGSQSGMVPGGAPSRTGQQLRPPSRTGQQLRPPSRTGQPSGAPRQVQQERDSSRTVQQVGAPSRTSQQIRAPSRTVYQYGASARPAQQVGAPSRTGQQVGVPTRTYQQIRAPSKTDQQAGDPSRTGQRFGAQSRTGQQVGVDTKKTSVKMLGPGAAKITMQSVPAKDKPNVHQTRMVVKGPKLKPTEKVTKCSGPCLSDQPPIPPFTEEVERGRPVPTGRYFIPTIGQADAHLPEDEKKLRQKLQKYQPTGLSHWKVELKDPFARKLGPLKEQHPDFVSGLFTSARGEYQPEEYNALMEQKLDPSLPQESWSTSLQQAMIHEEDFEDEDEDDFDLNMDDFDLDMEFPGLLISSPQSSPEVCPDVTSPRLPSPDLMTYGPFVNPSTPPRAPSPEYWLGSPSPGAYPGTPPRAPSPGVCPGATAPRIPSPARIPSPVAYPGTPSRATSPGVCPGVSKTPPGRISPEFVSSPDTPIAPPQIVTQVVTPRSIYPEPSPTKRFAEGPAYTPSLARRAHTPPYSPGFRLMSPEIVSLDDSPGVPCPGATPPRIPSPAPISSPVAYSRPTPRAPSPGVCPGASKTPPGRMSPEAISSPDTPVLPPQIVTQVVTPRSLYPEPSPTKRFAEEPAYTPSLARRAHTPPYSPGFRLMSPELVSIDDRPGVPCPGATSPRIPSPAPISSPVAYPKTTPRAPSPGVCPSASKTPPGRMSPEVISSPDTPVLPPQIVTQVVTPRSLYREPSPRRRSVEGPAYTPSLRRRALTPPYSPGFRLMSPELVSSEYSPRAPCPGATSPRIPSLVPEPFTPSLYRQPQTPAYSPSMVRRAQTPPPSDDTPGAPCPGATSPRIPSPAPAPFTPSLYRQPQTPAYSPSMVRRAQTPPPSDDTPGAPCPGATSPRIPSPAPAPFTPSLYRQPQTPAYSPSMVRRAQTPPPTDDTPGAPYPGATSPRIPSPAPAPYTPSMYRQPQTPAYSPSMVRRAQTPPPSDDTPGAPCPGATSPRLPSPAPAPFTPSLYRQPQSPAYSPSMVRRVQTPPPSDDIPGAPCPGATSPRIPSPALAPFTPSLYRQPQTPAYSPSMVRRARTPPPRVQITPRMYQQAQVETPSATQTPYEYSPSMLRHPTTPPRDVPGAYMPPPVSPIMHTTKAMSPPKSPFKPLPPSTGKVKCVKKEALESETTPPPLSVPPCVTDTSMTCSSKSDTPRFPVSPTKVPLPVSPITLEPAATVPSSADDINLDVIRRLVAEERQDVTASLELPPHLVKKINKMKMKPQSMRVLEETLNHSVPIEEESELLKSDQIASLLHSQEIGSIDPKSSPRKNFEHLFPPLADEAHVNISSAAPAPLQDIVVPIGEATPETVAVINEEIAGVAEETNLDIPQANAFSEAEKSETILLTSPLPKQKSKDLTPIKEKDEYIPHMTLEEQKPPWAIDLTSLEDLVGGKISIANDGEEIPSDESIRATAGRIEYILDVQKPLHYSCVQLRGSQMPAWFLGYYSVLPHVEGHIRLEKSPSKAFAAAWNVLAPHQQSQQSEIIVF